MFFSATYTNGWTLQHERCRCTCHGLHIHKCIRLLHFPSAVQIRLKSDKYRMCLESIPSTGACLRLPMCSLWSKESVPYTRAAISKIREHLHAISRDRHEAKTELRALLERLYPDEGATPSQPSPPSAAVAAAAAAAAASAAAGVSGAAGTAPIAATAATAAPEGVEGGRGGEPLFVNDDERWAFLFAGPGEPAQEGEYISIDDGGEGVHLTPLDLPADTWVAVGPNELAPDVGEFPFVPDELSRGHLPVSCMSCLGGYLIWAPQRRAA